MKSLLAVGVVTLIMATCVAASCAGDALRHRATLVGLGPVHVLVEEPSKDLKRSGLSASILQTDAELRLRAAGIRVATETESFALPGSPYLYVNVTGFPASAARGYVASVSVSLVQKVRLQRELSVELSAPTWSKLETVIGPSTETIRRSLRDLVDGFANAYLAANNKSSYAAVN